MHFKILTKETLLQFIPTVRLDDIREIEIVSGMHYDHALLKMFEDDGDHPDCLMFALAEYYDTRIYAVGGYDKSGLVWFVTAHWADSMTVSETISFIDRMQTIKRSALGFSDSRSLHNHVLSDNVMHIKFLNKLGADFGPATKINGHEFLPFTIK